MDGGAVGTRLGTAVPRGDTWPSLQSRHLLPENSEGPTWVLRRRTAEALTEWLNAECTFCPCFQEGTFLPDHTCAWGSLPSRQGPAASACGAGDRGAGDRGVGPGPSRPRPRWGGCVRTGAGGLSPRRRRRLCCSRRPGHRSELAPQAPSSTVESQVLTLATSLRRDESRV